MINQHPMGVGIIGVHPEKGWASMAHIPALAQLPEYRIVAVSHSNKAMADAAAVKFGVPNAMDSVDALVRHPEVELVVVAVKVTHHRPMIEAAVAAGKAILSEWPLTTDLQQAKEITQVAEAAGVRGFIGLQTRATPAFLFVRDLIREGYIGQVLSSNLIGSGLLWGAEISRDMLYTLDPANGASMINVTFAHSIDAVLYALGAEATDLVAMTTTLRKTVKIAETGDTIAMKVPDQVAVIAKLSIGAVLNTHFRGGMSRGSNFRWEINGTDGDLVISTPIGYTGVGGFTIQGTSGDSGLEELSIPDRYTEGLAGGLTQGIALAYRRIASDLRSGASLAPTFDDGLKLHRLIDRVSELHRA